MGMGISWKWELMTQLGMGMGRNGVTVGQLAAMDFFPFGQRHGRLAAGVTCSPGYRQRYIHVWQEL